LDRLLEKARYNKKKMKEALAGIKEIKFREIPEGSEEIADALIFYYGNKEKTIQALANLKKESIGTKNIPDALKWHFAGYWEHMFKEHPEYKGNQDLWPRSKDLLERSIALPVMVNWDDKFIDSYIDKVLKCLKV
jgi:8-amino-3,8-dideoxy-alpha-D-manno-octulosonate transaminase